MRKFKKNIRWKPLKTNKQTKKMKCMILKAVVVLGTTGSGAKNIHLALVLKLLLTKLFFKFYFVKTLMSQSCALLQFINHLSVPFTLMSCTGKRHLLIFLKILFYEFQWKAHSWRKYFWKTAYSLLCQIRYNLLKE